MTFNFAVKEFIIGGGTPTLQFYKRGFELNGGGQSPSWQDIILSGNTALTLTNALANGLNYLKLFGGTEQRNLPSEYVQNQFIWMKEGSYLLTNIIPTYDGHYELDFQTTTINTNAAAYLGGRAGQSPAGLIFSHGSGNVLVTDAFGQRYSIAYRVEDNTRYKYVFNNKVFTLYKNGEVVETHTFTSTNNSGAALAIKAINMEDSIDFAGEGIYFYGFKAWNNKGQLIADYIPATKLQGLVTGIYDKVTNTFLTATSGEWSSGPALQPTPDTPMDIVCNNGVLKVNRNLYSTEYHDKTLSQSDGITTGTNVGVNVSAMVDCTNVKSFMVTSTTTKGSCRIFKYRPDGTFINATTTSSIGQVLILPSDCGYFRIQYNYTSAIGTDTENILIYNSAYDLNGIYTDGTTEMVEAHGKNLFDVATYLSATISSGGTITATTGQNLYYMKVLPNNSYVFNYTTSASLSGNVVWGYAKDMPTIGGSTTYNYMTIQNIKNNVFNVPAGYNYLLIRLDATSFVPNMTNIQLELGTTATTYEPYFNGGTATAEMLLKVGTYQDVQSVINGSVTRNIGVMVLDGTEDWSLTGRSFRFDGNISFAQPNTCLCTHFNGWLSTDSINDMPDLSIKAGHPTNAYRVYARYDRFTTVEQLKSWLADQYNSGNPVVIVYPLATATTESVTAQPLTTQAGTNIIEITQASMDNLGLEVSYKATI